MTLAITILLFVLLIAIISTGIRLAWGLTKFAFGLGLFWVCPALFILVVLFGGFHNLWLPILLVGLLFGRGFRRA